MWAETVRNVRIAAIFAGKVLLEVIFGRVSRGWGPRLAYAAKWGGKWGAKSRAKSMAKSTAKCMANSGAKSMAIPRLISEAKSGKSFEIVEDGKNLKSVF